jgi:uncharacterized protein
MRLVPDKPLPPYAFVPGRFPHPTSDPAGHSFGRPTHVVAEADLVEWRKCETYLYGIDLFNHEYYWESHVEFESLWLACGRRGMTADFLKGLIKLAAAGVKYCEGKPAGVTSHSCRAAQLWRDVARGLKTDMFLGFRLQELVQAAEAICASGWPASPPLLVPRFPEA